MSEVIKDARDLFPVNPYTDGHAIPDLQQLIHDWAIRKEWRGPKADMRHFSDEVALIASEVFEALEAWRDTNSVTDIWWGYTFEYRHVKFKDMTEDQLFAVLDISPKELDTLVKDGDIKKKAMGVAPELADLHIRLLETCQEYGIPLLEWTLLVMNQNEKREVRHGGKPM